MAITFLDTDISQSFTVTYLTTELESILFDTAKVWSKSTPYTYSHKASDWSIQYTQASGTDNCSYNVGGYITLSIVNRNGGAFGCAILQARLQTQGCTTCTITGQATVGYGTSGSGSGQYITVNGSGWEVPRDVGLRSHSWTVSGDSALIQISVNSGGDGYNWKRCEINRIAFS